MPKLNRKRKIGKAKENKENRIYKRPKGVVETTTPQEAVFRNVVILTEIAKMLSSKKNLESFRLTNRACAEASSLCWRQNTRVQLHLLPNKWSNTERNIHQFLQRVDEKKPHQNYKLTNWFIHPASNPGRNFQRTVKSFWNMCGVFIKSLTLDFCTFDQIRLVTVICNYAPNLESLKIQCSVEDCRFRKELKLSEKLQPHRNLKFLYISTAWFSDWMFLEYFPNLVKLRLIQDVTAIESAYPAALRALRQKYEGSILNLKVLRTSMSKLSLDDFAAAQLPLEQLSVNLDGYVDNNKFRNMLSSVSGTLKYLKLFRLPFPRHPYQSSFIVNFSALEELHLCGRLVSSFNFLRETPSLRKLVVSWTLRKLWNLKWDPDMVVNSNVLLDIPNFEHSNLEDFEADFSFHKEDLQVLAKWLPKLKKLTTLLDDETLPVVRQLWPNLEDLQLPAGFEDW